MNRSDARAPGHRSPGGNASIRPPGCGRHYPELEGQMPSPGRQVSEMVEFRVKVSWAGGHGCAPSPRPPEGLPHGIPGAGLAGSGSDTTRAQGLAGLAGGMAEVRPRGAGQRRGMLRPGCRAVGRCQVEEMALRLPLWSRSRDRGGQDRVHVQLRDNPPARPRLPPDVHGRDRASELRIYAFQDSAFIASGRRGRALVAPAAPQRRR